MIILPSLELVETILVKLLNYLYMVKKFILPFINLFLIIYEINEVSIIWSGYYT